jgi:hypothetical protein
VPCRPSRTMSEKVSTNHHNVTLRVGSGLGEGALPGIGLAALQPVMLAAWVKAQVDFAAPMLWDGVVLPAERTLLGSAAAGTFRGDSNHGI